MAKVLEPETMLPLTAAVLAILLALAEEERHGYGIMKAAATAEGGGVKLGPGTLYGSLDRLVRDGLVEETGTTDDERRRYYRLTRDGRRVLAAELGRLQPALKAAARRGLLEGLQG
jgi:DNA-binding PadR family transcriptional regulator